MSLVETIKLLTLCRQGDALALERLVKEYQPPVYRLAYTILEDGPEAEEAAQDVFVAALKALSTYRRESSLTTWLYAITVNVCRDRLRARRTRERLAQALQFLAHVGDRHHASAEDEALRGEGEVAVRTAVNALGEKHRLPVILRYYHGCSVAEVAEILKLNEGTVCSRLATAREQLRVRLRPQLRPPDDKPTGVG
jgi:RNA polymerase sigma-70 factor (ECF subfamily)